MPATLSPYAAFRSAALDAGIDPEIVSILSDAYRDSEQHGWRGQALDWCGDPKQLIERALESPEKIAAVCSYFFASDGGGYREGLQYLPTKTVELAERAVGAGWGESEVDALFGWFYRIAEQDHVIALCKGHMYLAGRGWRPGTGSLRMTRKADGCCACSGTATIKRMRNAPLRSN